MDADRADRSAPDPESTEPLLGPLRFIEGAVTRAPRARLELIVWLVAGLSFVALVAWTTIRTYAWLYPPPPPENVAPAVEIRQDDGSMLAERALQATLKGKPAPHIIPKGYHEERRDQVTVAPRPAAAASGCPPVRVDLSLISDGHQRRVVASSPDGQVIAATDVPIDPPAMPLAPRVWAAGLSYSTQRAPGAWIERDIGRLRLGLAIEKVPGQQRPTERLQVGVSW